MRDTGEVARRPIPVVCLQKRLCGPLAKELQPMLHQPDRMRVHHGQHSCQAVWRGCVSGSVQGAPGIWEVPRLTVPACCTQQPCRQRMISTG